MNKKGIVSLEYILLFACVVSVLGLIVAGIVSLYNRNIETIDNSRFLDFCKETKDIIELFELMPEGKKEIGASNLEIWNIERTGKEIVLKNRKKDCKIVTETTVNLKTKVIEKKQKLVFTKQNNALNIG